MTMLKIPSTPVGESREASSMALYEDTCCCIYSAQSRQLHRHFKQEGNIHWEGLCKVSEEGAEGQASHLSGEVLIIQLQPDAPDPQRLQQDYVMTRSLALPILFQTLGFFEEPQPHFLMANEGWRPLSQTLRGIQGDLATQPDALHAHAGLSLAHFFAIAQALIQAVQALHEQWVSHGDLSLQCVWTHPQHPGIKLSNLGQARYSRQGDRSELNTDRVALVQILKQLHSHIIALDDASDNASSRKLNETLHYFQTSISQTDAVEWLSLRQMLQQLKHLEAQQTDAHGLYASEIEATTIPPAQLTLPPKIYGREQDVQQLLDIYERVGETGTELVLLAGASGVGKTALVEAVVQQLQAQWDAESKIGSPTAGFSPWSPKSPIIRCKFEQFKPRIPLEAITVGIYQVLQELDCHLDFEEALASSNTHSSAQSAVLMPWIQSMTSPHKPIILLLDDLHWADPASLNLMQQVMHLGADSPILIIGIYREQEVGPKHPLTVMVEQLRKAQRPCQTLTLSPLPAHCFERWIQEVLGCEATTAAPLAELVEQETQGNPFYVRQLLLALHRQGHLVYDQPNQRWTYDLAELKQQLKGEDLVEFLAHQLSALPETAQLALQLAACLGNQFQLDELAKIYPIAEAGTDKSTPSAPSNSSSMTHCLTLEVRLWPARQQGFVQRLGQNRYRFTHDRIQQAACLLLPQITPEEEVSNRWAIAQTLLSSLPMAGRDSQVFETIDQLDPAWHLVQSPERRAQLTQLNLVAGRRALVNQDYAAAIRYFTRGLEWLPANAWENHYELTLDLHEAACAAEYRHTNFLRAASLADVILEKAQALQDQAQAYEIRIRLHNTEAQHDQALELGLAYLTELGYSLEHRPQLPLSMSELAQLPMMTQREHLLTMRLLSQLIFPALQARPSLFPRLVGTMLQQTHQWGLSSYAAVAYAGLAVLQQDMVIAQQAIWILEHLNVQEMRGHVLLLITARVYVWQTPLREVEDSLAQIVQVALEAGELEVAAQATVQYCSYRFLSGASLKLVAEDYGLYQDMVGTLQQSLPSTLNQIFQNLVRTLRHKSKSIETDWWELPQRGEIPARGTASLLSSEPDPISQQQDSTPALPCITFTESLVQGILLFHGGHPRPALAALSSAFTHQSSMVGLLSQAICNFYSALCMLAICDDGSPPKRQALLTQSQHLQTQLRECWQQAPALFQHYDDLLTAERSRVLKQWSHALDYYERAIASAKAQNHGQNLALAYERTAHFYRQWRRPQLAASHLRLAHRAYLDWGAAAKAEALAADYPHLLLRPQEAPVASASQPVEAIHLNPIPEDSGLEQVLKTMQHHSQRLSSQASDWEKLTVGILQSAAELTPARRLLLVVQSPQQAFSASATEWSQRLEVPDLASIPSPLAPQAPIAPQSVEQIHWQVALTGQRQRHGSLWIKRSPEPSPSLTALPPILETTLSQGSTVTEPPSQQSPAFLALPLGNPSNPIALLYLESSETFTPQHQQRIELLSQQAAIALTHARTQTLLDHTIEHRTQTMRQEISERRRAEEKLAQQLKRARLLEMITQQIRENLHPDDMFRAAAQAIGTAFQACRCVIHRYSPNHPETMLPLVAEHLTPGCPSLRDNPLPIERNPYIQATLDQSDVVAISNVYTKNLDNEARVFCLQTELKSLLAVKTSHQGEANGMIALHQCDRFREWHQDEMELLTALANQVGIAQTQVQLLETEQQQRQALETAKLQAERTSQSKGQFIASLGHELRTPLNAILGFSRLMADAPETATQQRPMLQTINESGEHLLKLIEDVMAMAKLEAGRATLVVEDVDLVKLLRSIRDVFFLQTKVKGISFIIDRHSQVPRHIRIDGGKLRQILMNLVGNAVKFTQDGSIIVRVSSGGQTKQLEDSNATLELLRFEVEDTGPGIEATDIERLFEDFEQTEVGRREKVGTGLGLSISRKLVELMGGSIGVTSDPVQRQTIFRFHVLAERIAGDENEIDDTPSIVPDEEGKNSPSHWPRSHERLAANHLLVMDIQWIERLERAATLLDQEGIFQLLNEVPQTHQDLRDAIAQIAHQFAYETLIELSQTCMANQPSEAC